MRSQIYTDIAEICEVDAVALDDVDVAVAALNRLRQYRAEIRQKDADIATLFSAASFLIDFAKIYRRPKDDEPYDSRAGEALRNWDHVRGSIGTAADKRGVPCDAFAETINTLCEAEEAAADRQWRGCSLCDDPNAWMGKWNGVCPRCSSELPVVDDPEADKQDMADEYLDAEAEHMRGRETVDEIPAALQQESR